MNKLITIGASNSKNSINKILAEYTAGLIENVEVKNLDLNEFDLPIYSIDEETTKGIPEDAIRFREAVKSSDGIIISFAEHNGSFAVAYKNLYDWASRAGGNVWQNKPLLMLATSPGGRGAQGVLEHAWNIYSHSNENAIKGIALPSFHDNFASEKGIVHEKFLVDLQSKLKQFQSLL